METIKKTLLIITLCLMLTSCKTNYIPIITTNNITNNITGEGGSFTNGSTIEVNDLYTEDDVIVGDDLLLVTNGIIHFGTGNSPVQYRGDQLRKYYYYDFIDNGYIYHELERNGAYADFLINSHDNGFPLTPRICLGTSCLTQLDFWDVQDGDDDNPESGDVHWSDLTDQGTHTDNKLCAYDSGTGYINCNETTTRGSSSSLWWNNSHITTSNKSVEINGTITTKGGVHVLKVISEDSYGTINVVEGSSIFGYNEPFKFTNYGFNIFNDATMNLTGQGSMMVAKVKGDFSNSRTVSISGDGSLYVGYPTNGDVSISGDGALTVGTGNQINEQNAGINLGSQNNNYGSSNIAGINIGLGNKVNVSYCSNIGYLNTCNSGAVYGSTNIGGSNIQDGRQSANIGYDNDNSHNWNYLIGYGLESYENYMAILGINNNDLAISTQNITINKILYSNKNVSLTNLEAETIIHTGGLPNTGGNAGTTVCIDSNNQLCACGTCA